MYFLLMKKNMYSLESPFECVLSVVVQCKKRAIAEFRNEMGFRKPFVEKLVNLRLNINFCDDKPWFVAMSELSTSVCYYFADLLWDIFTLFIYYKIDAV